jgi:tetratricopeptide (TPR) repeat protein
MRLFRWFVTVVGLCLIALSGAAKVSVEETTVTIPTYLPGGYDKTPVFYTGRVYQGAQGRVYPYPMQDVLHDVKKDEIYKYLTLENDWLQMGLLPEHGGHLLNFTDKQTGFETFYRQHVIKPALIGMLGAWISGGVEWNFPHHHRATSAMPIDWKLASNKDGSKTIWIGETELRRRLKWTIGLSLLPDRAVLQAENKFMNRGPYIESMIYWANVSVNCDENYQVLFPPSCHLGFDHHKNFWTSFPIGPKRVDHSWIPSQRSKYAEDVDGDIDLSWWKNFTAESRSIFAMDPENAWIAGYDHKKNAGTAHVSNRHITVGKKFFLWGNFPEAHVWDSVLTDTDGPYLELMVGCWSDNQPDYSWIDPYETRTVKQYWFPVKGIGGVKNVTIDGAVNLERQEKKDEVLLGFHSTRVLKGCTVKLIENGKPVFTENKVAIDPDTPWCKTIKVSADIKNQALTGCLLDKDGKIILAYTPVPEDPHDPLPTKVLNPKPPVDYTSVEELYLTGLRLDQFHNGLIDPVPYYEQALKLDPSYSAANVALGIRLAKNGEYAKAEKCLRSAVARVTRNYTRAKDAEPEYMLALVLEEQARLASDPGEAAAKLKEAEDLFWRVTWRATLARPAYVELARLACLKGDWNEALDRVDDALDRDAKSAKLHVLKAYILRKLGHLKTASNSLRTAEACDALDSWGIAEQAFLKNGGKNAVVNAGRNRGLKAQQLLETVCDYWGIGAWTEVVELCRQADAIAANEKPYATEGEVLLKDTVAACDSYKNPLFAYFGGYATEMKGDVDGAKKLYAAAAEQSTDYCFPNRHEEYAVLKHAVRLSPGLANTWYYLGNVEWNWDLKAAALASWKKAVKLNSKHALALRNIGFGLAHPGSYFTNTGLPSGVPSREAYDYYKRALVADPGNFRTLEEMTKLAERLGVGTAERLATMKTYRATAEKYDACMLRLAYLFNEAENYDESLKILTTRRFHVWEGGEGLLSPFVDALLLRGLNRMAAKDFGAAQKDFEMALTYPDNLQAGRPGDAGMEPKVRYYLAQCRKQQGDQAGCKAELENALKGWVKPGEMNYYRIRALTELGKTGEVSAQLDEIRKAIATLEEPQPQVIDAYAKFGGENTPVERAGHRKIEALYLRGLVALAEGKPAEAKELFGQVIEARPAMIWAKAMLAE